MPIFLLILSTIINPSFRPSLNPTVRNQIEFATEGYNWRQVCTEEEMYTFINYSNINNNNGENNTTTIAGTTAKYELIHPVHFDSGEYTFSMGGQVIKVSSDRLWKC